MGLLSILLAIYVGLIPTLLAIYVGLVPILLAIYVGLVPTLLVTIYMYSINTNLNIRDGRVEST